MVLKNETGKTRWISLIDNMVDFDSISADKVRK